MRGKKIVRIGIDFDGVLVYNPFRIVRAPITYAKRKILGERKLKFYVPKTSIEKAIWAVLHESSIFPAKGAELFRKMARDQNYEFHLVTARFHYLEPNLMNWLKRHQYTNLFSKVHMNVHDQQPHLHKLEKIQTLNLDYFIEDNWDIVEFLQGKTTTRVMWIYNIIDRGRKYTDKYPYLEKALQAINS